MDGERQRIKIAEACGWVDIRAEVDWLPGELTGIFTWQHPTKEGETKYYINRKPVPNYLYDLNAMHRAEKILKLGLRNRYDAELSLIAERDYCFIWETSAAQRAEAFLRTLDSWIEKNKI